MLGTHQVDVEPKLAGAETALGLGLQCSVVGTTAKDVLSLHWPAPASRGSKREALRCCPPSQSPPAVSFQMSPQLLAIESDFDIVPEHRLTRTHSESAPPSADAAAAPSRGQKGKPQRTPYFRCF